MYMKGIKSVYQVYLYTVVYQGYQVCIVYQVYQVYRVYQMYISSEGITDILHAELGFICCYLCKYDTFV